MLSVTILSGKLDSVKSDAQPSKLRTNASAPPPKFKAGLPPTSTTPKQCKATKSRSAVARSAASAAGQFNVLASRACASGSWCGGAMHAYIHHRVSIVAPLSRHVSSPRKSKRPGDHPVLHSGA